MAKLSKMLQVRLTEEEQKIIDLMARFERHTRSTLARDLLFKHAKKLARTNPQFARELAKIRRAYAEEV